MKKTLLISFLVCCGILSLFARPIAPAPGGPIVTSGPFRHPGMLDTRESLDFVKAKITAGEEPWKSAFRQVQHSQYSSLKRKPAAVPVIDNGPYNKPNIGGTEFYNDGQFAYTQALMWYLTGDRRHAEKAIEILNDWSYTLDTIINSNTLLKIGVGGIKYLNAAEIIKHTYDGWAEKDQAVFGKMILEMWYELIKNFKPRTNGNWDAAICQTMMCIGIFLDRRDIFDRAYNHLMYGESLGAIRYYITDTGQCQESGRDYGHVQMGIGYLGCACEVAWNQGLDLYGAYDNRLALGFEHASKYMLGNDDVPFEQYITYWGSKSNNDVIGAGGRGKFAPIYERIYNHYQNRKGVEMPWTWKVIVKTRNETLHPGWAGDGFMPWTTLLYAQYPIPGESVRLPNGDMKAWDSRRSASPGYVPLPEGYTAREGHERYFSRSDEAFEGLPAVRMAFAGTKGNASYFATPPVEFSPGKHELVYFLKGTGFIRSVNVCTANAPEEDRRAAKPKNEQGVTVAITPMGDALAARTFENWYMQRVVFDIPKEGRYAIHINHNNRKGGEENQAADPSDPLLISGLSLRKITPGQ